MKENETLTIPILTANLKIELSKEGTMQKLAIILIIIFFFSGLAFTQEQYGNIRGVVLDEQGHPLPGVRVTLDSGLYNPRSITTTESGIFRFINIYPGTYKLICELSGLKSYIQENLITRVGNNFDLQIVMEPATLEEEVTIIAQSPIVDTKKTGTASNVTLDMLQEIPSARDPWVILQHVPGIDMYTENVGGSHSGQQSVFTSKGGSMSSTMWNLDGIPITDMVALGYSSRYFDFDSFAEMQVVTSGAKAAIHTSGVSINIITRRGSNKFEVMGRVFFANDDLQGDNRTQELKDLDYVGNRINQIWDYGLQVGGPLKKDKLWFWIGHGVQDIRRLTIDGYPHEIKIVGYNTKLNFQIHRNNRGELNINYYDKRRDGFGVGPLSPPETSWDQTADSTFIKLEDTHTFSNNFLLTLKLATSFGLGEFIPKGGMNVQAGYDYFTGMYSGSYNYIRDERPSHSAKIDGNYFVENLLGGDHEFQFGVEYRLTPARNYTVFPQDVYKYYWDGEPFFAEVSRERNQDSQGDRYSFYINDSYSRGRLTLNLGFRFDREKSVVNEATVEASQIAPELLPQLTFPAIDPGFSFKTLSPRIGFTFALTKDRKTILRGNLARYSQPMTATLAN
ncbi:MAG: TonB-dependent receptor, partial [Deltaproteobacteria bacterium]|nr:TonB-dependent receptor [Deltaproteobacteria bacterium]